MAESKDQKKWIIVSTDTHRELRIQSALSGRSMRELADEILQAGLAKMTMPVFNSTAS